MPRSDAALPLLLALAVGACEVRFTGCDGSSRDRRKGDKRDEPEAASSSAAGHAASGAAPTATPSPAPPPPPAKFVRERPVGDDVKGVDACAFIGGFGFACLDALLAETDPVKKRYMRRLSDSDARDALEAEKKGEGGIGHAELAMSCSDDVACGTKDGEGNKLDDGYACLTKAENARIAKEPAAAKAAHAKACKCSSARAQIPVMGGYLACDGDKPVERGRDMDVAVAKDVRDCGTCDAEAGPAACARELGRLRASDAPLATYLETVHVARCQKK